MSRVTTFLLGMIVGAASLFVAENYYVVRSTDRLHLVPKVAAKLEFPYRDIRSYTVDDWKKNVSLGAAIVKAQKPGLMVDSLSSVKHNFESILQSWIAELVDRSESRWLRLFFLRSFASKFRPNWSTRTICAWRFTTFPRRHRCTSW